MLHSHKLFFFSEMTKTFIKTIHPNMFSSVILFIYLKHAGHQFNPIVLAFTHKSNVKREKKQKKTGKLNYFGS